LAADELARGNAVDFAISNEQRRAFVAFLSTDGESLTRKVPTEVAGRYVRALDCIRCHSRDAQASWWPDILAEEGVRGTLPELLPQLTWVGEKLQVLATEQLVAGTVGYKPRPWLTAQMPTFPARARDLALGLAAEHGFAAAPRLGPPLDMAKAEVGRQLSERQGFFCIECHAVAEQPAAGALSHHGVNFARAAQRINFDDYRRWITDPVRVDPGSKMPRFSADGVTTPRTNIYEGDAQRQFEALWHYLVTLRHP
jgi:hypothetical protein